MRPTPPRPVLMRKDEVRNLDRAAYHAERSPKTVRRWCHLYGIGRQTCPGAPLEVSILGLEMVLHGDMDALERLREGQRDHPDVRRYASFLGLRE